MVDFPPVVVLAHPRLEVESDEADSVAGSVVAY